MEYKAGDTAELLENHDGYRKGSIITITGIDRRTYGGKIIYAFKGEHGNSRAFASRFKLHTSTPKFKVGETVRVIGDSGSGGGGLSHREKIGSLFTVAKYHKSMKAYDLGENVGNYIKEQDLELVAENEYWGKSFLEMIHGKKEKTQKEEQMRLVSIFVYDPRCPAEKAMVHKDTEVLTNDTNEILRHEVKKVVMDKLKAFNAMRVQLKDDKGDKFGKVGMDDLVIGIEEYPLRTSSA